MSFTTLEVKPVCEYEFASVIVSFDKFVLDGAKEPPSKLLVRKVPKHLALVATTLVFKHIYFRFNMSSHFNGPSSVLI